MTVVIIFGFVVLVAASVWAGMFFQSGDNAIGWILVCLVLMLGAGSLAGAYDAGTKANYPNTYKIGAKIQYGGVDGTIKTNLDNGKFAIEVKGQIYIVEPDDVEVVR